MNEKKIVLVTGATGAQGGSVAKALLADGQFAVRILTRNAASANALALQAAGASIAEGNLDDIDSLRAAMNGCYAVFGVTNFWEHFEKEFEHGKNLIDAVHQSNISHFVLHTLPDYKRLSHGQFAVPHCDLKAALEQYARSLQLPATFLRVAFYYENFLSFFPLQANPDGSLSFGFPQGDTKLAMISAEDIGGMVLTILKHPEAYIKRVVGAVGADDTCEAYAAIMSRALGRTVRYHHIPRDIYASLGFPGAEELANMFEVQRLYITSRQIDLIETYALNHNTQPFEAWMHKHASKFLSLLKEKQEAIAQ